MQNQQQPHLAPLHERLDRIRSLARTLVRDAATADDLVQQAVLIALSGGASVSAPQSEGWIRTVLTNLLRDRRRSERSRALREGRAAREEGSVSSTHAVVSNAERHRDLVEAVLELPEPYRETVLLRHFEDLPPREIARRTGRPVETVKKHLTRGHAQLRARLEEHYGGQGQWAVALLPLAGDGVLRGVTTSLPLVKLCGALAIAGGLAFVASVLPVGANDGPQTPRAKFEVAAIDEARGDRPSERIAGEDRASSDQRVPIASATAPVTGGTTPSDPRRAVVDPNKATLPVTLLDPNGVPVNGGVIVIGRVELRSEDPSSSLEEPTTADVVEFLWSEEDDVLRLDPGRVKLRGFSGLFDDAGRDSPYDAREASAMEHLELEPGPNPRVTLVTQPRSGLHVTPKVEGVPSPVVRILRLQPGAELDEDALSGGDLGEDSFGWMRNSTDDAVWTFMDLEPGTYAVGAMDWLGPLYGHQVVEVGPSLIEMELVIGAPGDRQLTVFAAGSDGHAVLEPERIRFSLERSRAGEEQVARGLSSQNPDGSLTVWFPDEQAGFFDPSDPTAQYTLVVRHPAYGQVRAPLRRGQLAVDVTFGDPVSVQVRLENFRGETLLMRFVNLQQIEQGLPSTDTNYSKVATFGPESGGEARIEGLTPGRYRASLVSLTFAGGSLEESTIGSQVVEVWQEDTPVTLEVPQVHELEVVAPDLQEGVALVLTSIDPAAVEGWDQQSWTRTLDASRGCTFQSLLPGTYLLEHEGGSAPVRVSVPCEVFTLR